MDEGKVVSEKVVFRQLMRKDVADLLNGEFYFSKDVLAPPVEQKILHAARLISHEIRIVAFHVEDKRAIGHLKLVNHTKSLYSIKYVFTNPRYRKLGVASRLFKYALALARKKGGKKLFLTADLNDDSGRLFAKLGFRPIVNTSTILTGGFPELPFENQNRLVSLDLHSKSNRHKLYRI
jgi:predicted GNAT family acetyltransferase